MIFRIWGIVLVTTSGFFCGWIAANKTKKHRLALEELIWLLRYIQDAVQYTRTPCQEIFRELQRTNMLQYIDLSQCNTIQELVPPAVLSKEEAHHFRSCFSQIGYGSATQLCEQLAQYIRRFEASLTPLSKQEQEKSAVYPKVGLCIGAMIALACL